jgi:hypothetical protein
MLIIASILFSVAALLFLLSIFYKGTEVNLKKELEQLSLEHIQEVYQLKKRIRALEEEIMQEESFSESSFLDNSFPIHEVIQNQVVHLYKQGLSIDQIARQSALTIDEVFRILESQGGDFH